MSDPVTAADVQRARAAGAGIVRRTPVLSSRTLSDRCGGTVALKAENLQRTGSFKLRGALAKIAALGDACAAGVTAGSAGNHGQAVAYAARSRGIPCEVFMPAEAPIAKAEAAAELGACIHLDHTTLEEAVAAARERAAGAGMTFVHPFDDADVVSGQGTLGLELLDEVADLARVVVPMGGGGLASGVAIAVKSARPEVEVVGVQAEGFAPYPAALGENAPPAPSEGDAEAITIADGIAVKAPGELTLPLVRRWLDGVEVVGEDAIATAMAVLLERAKLVVEGAGAVGVAALLAGVVAPASRGTTVAILSGGNVDPGLLGAIARRAESEAGRRLVLLTRVPDRPGRLAALLDCVAAAGANLVEVSHVREGLDLHIRETAVELVLETRGKAHAERVLAAISAAGYATRVLS